MLYSTIVQRDETGFNMIYDAAREFEHENVLEAITSCKFSMKKVEQTLNLVRMYQLRLNNESMDIVEFSENFIEQYSTDHNECFRLTEKLVRRIGTTITGSMKIFRKFCPVVRRTFEGDANIVPTLDYTRLRFRQFPGQFFGPEVYADRVKTLLHEIATFFYHLVTVLKVCKDMIRQEEEVMGDYERLKQIWEKSCDEVLHCVRDVYDTFGQVKLVSEEELIERRKNARPMREWLPMNYHAHDKKWQKREAYIYRLASGRNYGLDETASMLWAKNPQWGQTVCGILPKLNTLNIPWKHSKKAEQMGKKGTYESREMVYMLKWGGVSSVSPEGKVIDEANERGLYMYIQNNFKTDFAFPTWQSVCRERRFLYSEGISVDEMANNFASYLTQPDRI